MVRAMHHRGPDAHGTRTFQTDAGRQATLGAVRLRIIDVAPTADQPMSDATGSVWTVFNGELYNFKELRAELSAMGYAFRTSSDTECLVHLYDYLDGDVARIASRLRGMFAFAIWDNTRGRLVAARDRLGIKPFHWTPTPHGFAFCSEQRGLAAAGLIDGAPNLDAIAGYLAKGVVANGQNILRDAQHLNPGEALIWDGGKPITERWWRPVLTTRADLLPRERAQAHVTASVTDAVARHLVADRAVGVFLSSGTDSAAIATLAAQSGAQRSLTVRFPDEPALDEGDAAAATAAHLGFDHIEVPVTGRDAAELMPAFLQSLDSPTADGFNNWLVCRAAREAGLVVVLSGVGGDELFAGYRTFRQVPWLRAISPVISRLPSTARRVSAHALRRRPQTRQLARAFSAAPGSAGAYHAIRRIFDDAEIEGVGLAKPRLLGLASDPGGIDAVTLLELESYLRDQLLPDADTTSMSHSLELRVPLLDDKVVDAALALPMSMRTHGKQLLATAAGLGERPPKRTFTLPLEHWLAGPLRDTLRDALLDDTLPFADVLPTTFRQRLWTEYELGRAHWNKAWSVAVLRMWPGANGLAA